VQNHDGKAAIGQILLVFQVSVGGDKYLKACRFSYCNERAILQA